MPENVERVKVVEPKKCSTKGAARLELCLKKGVCANVASPPTNFYMQLFLASRCRKQIVR